MSFTIPLPTYERREQVQALKIKAVVPNPRGYELHFQDQRFCPIQVNEDWAELGDYLVGGYLTVSKDGMLGWIAGSTFEAGYTLVPGLDPHDDVEAR